MKKRIQKYLAGEREGFSLVELIIVIAIMAILIGVIALAVIPNIQRSRESKDLSTLDNIMSSVNIAIANNKINASGDFTYPSTDPGAGADAKGKVIKAVWDELGKIELGSSAGTETGTSIYVSWVVSDAGAAKVTVTAGTATNKATGNPLKYTTDPDHLIVKSGAGS